MVRRSQRKFLRLALSIRCLVARVPDNVELPPSSAIVAPGQRLVGLHSRGIDLHYRT